MVRVILSRDTGMGTISLTVSGHAGQAEEGHDLVCSACSILAYTVAQIVNTEKLAGSFKTEPIMVLSKGGAYISCEPIKEMYNEILHTFYVAEVGYTLLSHNYPQYVDLTTFGEAE